jgi:hypothetical protein
MKLRYFGYYLREFDSQEPFLYNIKSIVDAFVSSNNIELKSSFKRGDEKLYLTKVAAQQNLYYFVRTSDDGIIKQINERSITVGEISDNLGENEKIAFASYVYICPKLQVVACASGMSSPRFDDFTDYINEMFQKIELNNFEIGLSALTTTSNKKDLLEMEVVNSIYIDIAADRDISRYLCQKLTGSESGSIGNLRITIEPSGSNMRDVFRKIVHTIDTTDKAKNSNGILQIGAKAKHDELKGQLMDHWLDNENNLTDQLNPKAKRNKLPDQICKKFDQNEKLESLFKAYVSNNRYKEKRVPLLEKYKKVTHFSSKKSDIDTSKDAENDNLVSISEIEQVTE